MKRPSAHQLVRWALWIGLIQSLAALIGSLIASEIMLLPACDMCWWQRVAWYPLVVLFAVALFTGERRSLFWSALPLTIFGFALALYQTLLQWHLFAEDSLLPCSLDNPCGIPTSMFPPPLDVITIPFMSVLGFMIIGACLWVIRPARPART